MNAKKWIILTLATVCVVSGSVYAWGSINTTSVEDDMVVVYDDGGYTATVSKEEYDTLSESYKANTDSTYKKIIEIIEKNSKVVDDETAKVSYEQTGNVAEIANNFSCVSVEVLDEIFVDYIAQTNDIGMVVVAKDYLSQEAIDKIVKKYVATTEDVGILEVLKDCVSEEVLEELREM